MTSQENPKMSMLSLSSAHVKPETLDRCQTGDFEWLVCYAKKNPANEEEVFGAFILVHDIDPFQDNSEEIKDIPEDLLKVLRYAKRSNCDWVMFDSDYDEIGDLPTYRDEWDKVFCLDSEHNSRKPKGQSKGLEMETIEERDTKLEALWDEFDIPIDPETECIEEPFLHFQAGTHREEVWHWFDERYSGGVVALMFHERRDGVLREKDHLYALRQKCTECESETCVFNPDGVCMYPMVFGKIPTLNDDGCDCWTLRPDIV